MVEIERMGRQEGRQIGRLEGRKEAILDITKKMIEENISIDKISRVTGFSEVEIESVKKL